MHYIFYWNYTLNVQNRTKKPTPEGVGFVITFNNVLSLEVDTNDCSVIQHNSAFLDRAEVANLLLTNSELIICNEVKLGASLRIDSDTADKCGTAAVNAENDIVSSSKRV